MNNCVASLYERFHAKLNDQKTLTDNQIHYYLNEAQEIYFEGLLKDEDNEIRQLRVPPLEIKPIECTKDYCVFEYPNDFYKRLNITLIAKKCGNQRRKLKVHIVQNDDIIYLLEDPFYKPSYEWRETLATIHPKGLLIYKDDFEIEKIILEYYRKPCEITFASCTQDKEYTLKSGRKVTQDQFELCDKFQIRKISDIASLLALMDYQDPNFQTYLNKILNF